MVPEFGLEDDPLRSKAYIRETRNIFGEACRSFEIVNSPVMAPAGAIFMNPGRFTDDRETYGIFGEFIREHGPFDVIHFNNIEGISSNVLALKEEYPDTRFVVSIHNYQPICPLVQYYQYRKSRVCRDFGEGRECLACAPVPPDRKAYLRRCRIFLYERLPRGCSLLKFPLKVFAKCFGFRGRNYTGSEATMKAADYARYREHNIEYLNRYADIILAVSDRVREIMTGHGTDPERIKTSYIGTRFAESELGRSAAQVTAPFTIAYLGYEREDKGFFFLTDSLAQLPEAVSRKINIVLAVADLHEEHVFPKLNRFNEVIVHKGYTHDNLREILSRVNLGIVPVLWEDNLPQVAIEMVAFGVPILCSDLGGASELSGSPLFRFKAGDSEDLNARLIGFVEDPAMLNEYWKQHPKLTTMERHVEELYKYYGKK